MYSANVSVSAFELEAVKKLLEIIKYLIITLLINENLILNRKRKHKCEIASHQSVGILGA